MVYAYYVVMGGFAVKIDHLHNTVKQGTLTTNALLLLAQHGHFFSLTKETISDKSKANCKYALETLEDVSKLFRSRERTCLYSSPVGSGPSHRTKGCRVPNQPS